MQSKIKKSLITTVLASTVSLSSLGIQGQAKDLNSYINTSITSEQKQSVDNTLKNNSLDYSLVESSTGLEKVSKKKSYKIYLYNYKKENASSVDDRKYLDYKIVNGRLYSNVYKNYAQLNEIATTKKSIKVKNGYFYENSKKFNGTITLEDNRKYQLPIDNYFVKTKLVISKGVVTYIKQTKFNAYTKNYDKSNLVESNTITMNKLLPNSSYSNLTFSYVDLSSNKSVNIAFSQKTGLFKQQSKKLVYTKDLKNPKYYIKNNKFYSIDNKLYTGKVDWQTEYNSYTALELYSTFKSGAMTTAVGNQYLLNTYKAEFNKLK